MLEKFVIENTEFYNPFDSVDDPEVESRAIVQTALDILSPQRKKIYTLVKLEGKSYGEMADLLGISTSTAGRVEDKKVFLEAFMCLNDVNSVKYENSLCSSYHCTNCIFILSDLETE
jgi:hypothetical protein